MSNKTYPQGAVLALINSPHVTPQTAAVLAERLSKMDRVLPHFFGDEEFYLLEAVCECLYPTEEDQRKIPLAALLEESIATGAGKGWRYDNLPPTKVMFKEGLKATDEEAQTKFGKAFVALTTGERNSILQAIQDGQAAASGWKSLSPQMFFTELLVAATEQYYSHPQIKDSIGDASFADLPLWQHISLNGNDGREPLNTTADAKP